MFACSLPSAAENEPSKKHVERAAVRSATARGYASETRGGGYNGVRLAGRLRRDRRVGLQHRKARASPFACVLPSAKHWFDTAISPFCGIFQKRSDACLPGSSR